jgi:uncharacterized protein (DUF58 family)
MKARVFLVLLVFAIAGLVMMPSATATTAPAVQVTIKVTVTDKGITMSRYQARRGWAAHFVVRNTGTKPYAVDIGGLLTGLIKPGTRKTVSASLEERGTYPFKVILSSPTKKHSGVFRVT